MTMAEKFMIVYVGTKEKSYAAIWSEWLFLIDEKTFDNDNQPKVYFTDGTAVAWNRVDQVWELVG